MKRFLLALIVGMFVVAYAGCAAHAGEYVWIEGEQPSRQNFEVAGVGWGNVQYLSQEKWLAV